MDELTTRAIRLDPASAQVWALRSISMHQLRRWTAALEALDQAIKRDPYSPRYHGDKANTMTASGRPSDALPLIDRALELGPENPSNELTIKCFALLLLGQSDQATQLCEQASGADNWWWPQAYLVALYANKGESQKLATALRPLKQVVPGFTIAQAKEHSDHPEYRKLAEKYFYSGLRKAGTPES
jgi:tetratricopeptide (TPR) repeat protein